MLIIVEMKLKKEIYSDLVGFKNNLKRVIDVAVKRWDSGYLLIRDRSGMQLINQNMEHRDSEPYGHIHSINHISYAKSLVEDAESNTVPRDRSIRHLQDLKRITSDRRLRKELEQLINVKIDKAKSCDYYNIQ